MKIAFATLLALAFATQAAFAKAKPAQPLSDGQCYDIKQSVLADLPHFCGSAKTDKTRAADFGSQIDLLEKRCAQPQLAHLLRKALAQRVEYADGKGCTATTEKAVLPAKARAAVADGEL